MRKLLDEQPDAVLPREMWSLYRTAAQHAGDVRAVAEALEALTEDGTKATADEMAELAQAYFTVGRMASALATLRELKDRFPEHPDSADSDEIFTAGEASMRERYASLSLDPDKSVGVFALADKVQLALERSQFERVETLAEAVHAVEPDFPPVLNNVSLARFMQGDTDGALATNDRVLARFPENTHALSNRVRFLLSRGERDEARLVGERLRPLTVLKDQAEKRLEAFALLGDDAAVCGLFDEDYGLPDLNEPFDDEVAASLNANQLFAYHLAAVSLARTGRGKEADRLWDYVLTANIAPFTQWAEENREQREKPIGERYSPFPFPMPYWFPFSFLKSVQSASRKTKNPDDFKRVITESLPTLTPVLSALLERGDEQAVLFALQIGVSFSERPEIAAILESFALGNNQPDRLRLKAAQELVDVGVWEPGYKTVWRDGEPTELLLSSLEITTEPAGKLPRAVTELMGKANDAHAKGEHAEAERIMLEARQLEPFSPEIANNLAAMIMVQEGREDEAEAMIRSIHELFPEYVFGILNHTRLAIRDGDYDTARESLDGLMMLRKMHLSEYTQMCRAQVDLALAQDNKDAAKSWLDMWQQVDPSDEQIFPYLMRLTTPEELMERFAALKKPGRRR